MRIGPGDFLRHIKVGVGVYLTIDTYLYYTGVPIL